MFKKLQQRWKVGPWGLFLVISTFAIGGSLCGYFGRKLMGLTGINNKAVWVVVYIILLTIIWPACVLLVSIPLGQFNFFKQYLQKMVGKRKRPSTQAPIAMAVFASGGGSNAAKIIEFSLDPANQPAYRVVLVVCNNPSAGVLDIARKHGIATLLINKSSFINGDAYVPALQQAGVQLIALAGFLWKVPPALVKAFPKSIINIHPALLPKFGGKGMYGIHVHQAVINAGERRSGITIHYVDEEYDHGGTILQAECDVLTNDDAPTLAARVLQLEHQHFARVINELAQNAKS